MVHLSTTVLLYKIIKYRVPIIYLVFDEQLRGFRKTAQGDK